MSRYHRVRTLWSKYVSLSVTVLNQKSDSLHLVCATSGCLMIILYSVVVAHLGKPGKKKAGRQNKCLLLDLLICSKTCLVNDGL